MLNYRKHNLWRAFVGFLFDNTYIKARVQKPYPIYDQNDQNQLKWIPYLWPKRLRNHTLWGRTYLYSPYKGVPPRPPGLKTSEKAIFEENITQFKRRLRDRDYPDNLIENTLSEIKFSERMPALQNKQKTRKRVLPFVTEYCPSVPNLKNVLMSKWHLIENQPLLR